MCRCPKRPSFYLLDSYLGEVCIIETVICCRCFCHLRLCKCGVSLFKEQHGDDSLLVHLFVCSSPLQVSSFVCTSPLQVCLFICTSPLQIFLKFVSTVFVCLLHSLHNLKYLNKLIKCLEMRAKIKSKQYICSFIN